MKDAIFEEHLSRRHSVFIGGAIFITACGSVLLLRSYSGEHLFWTDYIVFGLFPLLFGQIALGFMLCLFGFYDWLRRGDPLHIMRRAWRKHEDTVSLAATAIVVPIYNEDVQRVTQAISNMWISLKNTGQLEHFDFYVCSDSSNPDTWIEEECAWIRLCQELNAFGKLFYRKRRHAINAKSGNIADFCRRWGKRYRYMIILDADSVMSGPVMVRLVRAMEANPQVGILQTPPVMVLGQSLFRRMLQFSGRFYGKLFIQGCSMTQLSSASYWGHNAVIRMAPFMEHCGLPQLPVPRSDKRHVLSHDTVEAALMRRAGYEVWIAYEEVGSYEEGPPNLTAMLTRDRRWCAGNLQHFWFLLARGLAMGNRLQIWIGLMAYLCSPIWLVFLIAGSLSAYYRARFMLYSAGLEDLPVQENSCATVLFFITMILLFAPRLLGIFAALPDVSRISGIAKTILSVLLEIFLSILIAPILMLFHTLFVILAISGWQVKWVTQDRAANGLTFSHCITLYGWQTCLGIVSQVLCVHYMDLNWYWLTPIFIAWIFAPITAWLTSLSSLGQWLRTKNIFVTPEECETPTELGNLDDTVSPVASSINMYRWVQALLLPYVLSLHLSMLHQRSSAINNKVPSRSITVLRERLIQEGTLALTAKEKMTLLWDAETVFWLHRELWFRPASELHSSWQQHFSEIHCNKLL